MSLVASGKLAPTEWVESLLQLEPAQLDEEPFGPMVLLVRAPDDDDTGQFLKHIVACVKKEAQVTGEHARWPTTSQFPTMRMSGVDVSEADQIELLAELSSAPHCIVPLRRARPGKGVLVGRGTHADIRLADPSVSAEHARILVEDGGIRLMDVGSKNGTLLNGRRLDPSEAPWLQPMDRLAFGRVQGFACDPRVLRIVVRQDLRTLI